MKFADLICHDAVIPQLQAADRNGVIRELVAALATAGKIAEDDVADIAKAIITRENQATTGFGKGVAVPHVKHPKIANQVAAMGRSAGGIDFSALDRAPVYSVFVLLTPADKADLHLPAMECVFRHLQHDNFRRFLRQAETRQAIVDLLKEADGS